MPHNNSYDLVSPELPGRLIIVEGIDGSGKSTQLDLLRKWLVNQGYLVIFSTSEHSRAKTHSVLIRDGAVISNSGF